MKQINLIIGYGYLGKSLIKLLHGQSNYVTNRSKNSHADSPTGYKQQLVLNINDKHNWDSLDLLPKDSSIKIYLMVPPGQIDRSVFSSFISRLNKLHIERAILVSSTVVYGNINHIVDADSDINIDSDRAKRQYFIEYDWLAAIKKGSVVRLAGIYGPNRVIGQSGIMNGVPISGNPDGWLNLIHVDDGAELVKCISDIDNPEPIELGCDGSPIKRREYYSFLAKQLKQSEPKFNHDEHTRGLGRRCDNKITINRTGWRPKHTDFRKVVSSLVNQSEGLSIC